MELTDKQIFSEFLFNLVAQDILTPKQAYNISINIDTWFKVFQYYVGYGIALEEM